MNAKQVLGKILTVLSLEKEEVLFAYAKLADGTILESPSFDAGESIEVVSEDGKVPAPDGEHELTLKDAEGNEETFKVIVKDGQIAERENVELPATPEDGAPMEMDSMAGDDAAQSETPDAEVKEPQDIPQTLEKLSYRIEELEKRFAEMAGINEEETTKPDGEDTVKVGENSSQMSAVKMAAVEPDEEEDLPKLDGAPIDEEPKKLNKFGKKTISAQGSFLSKLYN
jgi:hypothetical protein